MFYTCLFFFPGGTLLVFALSHAPATPPRKKNKNKPKPARQTKFILLKGTALFPLSFLFEKSMRIFNAQLVTFYIWISIKDTDLKIKLILVQQFLFNLHRRCFM